MNVKASFWYAFAVLLAAGVAFGHCDTLDGPVVKAARQALDSGKVSYVLIWVTPQNEAEVRGAFEKTVAVRKLGEQAKELADMYFFETVVRLHRAGEGAPYTGLKPAGADLGPVVPAADKAIETGSVDALRQILSKAVDEGVRHRFEQVISRKSFKPDNVEAGRQYVRAYVEFVHYVERIHLAAEGRSGSGAEPQEQGQSAHSHSESH